MAIMVAIQTATAMPLVVVRISAPITLNILISTSNSNHSSSFSKETQAQARIRITRTTDYRRRSRRNCAAQAYQTGQTGKGSKAIGTRAMVTAHAKGIVRKNEYRSRKLGSRYRRKQQVSADDIS